MLDTDTYCPWRIAGLDGIVRKYANCGVAVAVVVVINGVGEQSRTARQVVRIVQRIALRDPVATLAHMRGADVDVARADWNAGVDLPGRSRPVVAGAVCVYVVRTDLDVVPGFVRDADQFRFPTRRVRRLGARVVVVVVVRDVELERAGRIANPAADLSSGQRLKASYVRESIRDVGAKKL